MFTIIILTYHAYTITFYSSQLLYAIIWSLSISTSHSQVILNSMHKYQPRVHIVKASDEKAISLQPADRDSFTTHIFPETQFMAVTAYQNQQVCAGRGHSEWRGCPRKLEVLTSMDSAL